MRCPNCAAELTDGAEACKACGHVIPQRAGSVPAVSQPLTMVVRTEKNAGLAAVFSFFYCGLGQIYNGQIGKGIAFIVAYTISLLAMFVIIGFITTPALWIWGMIDAYKTAEKLNLALGLTKA